MNLQRTTTLLAVSALGLFASCARLSPGSELAGTSWQALRIMSMDDSIYSPATSARYTLDFAADGVVTMQLDCNRGSGRWRSAMPGQLTFGPIAATRALCADSRFHDRYLSQFEWVRSYVLSDGRLYLATMADGAIIEFEPLRSPLPKTAE